MSCAAELRPTSFAGPRCSMNPPGPAKLSAGMSAVAAYSVGSAPPSSLCPSSRLPTPLTMSCSFFPLWNCRFVAA